MHVSVVVLPYDSQEITLEALLSLAERAIQGRTLQSVGILAEGSTDEVILSEGTTLLQH